MIQYCLPPCSGWTSTGNEEHRACVRQRVTLSLNYCERFVSFRTCFSLPEKSNIIPTFTGQFWGSNATQMIKSSAKSKCFNKWESLLLSLLYILYDYIVNIIFMALFKLLAKWKFYSHFPCPHIMTCLSLCTFLLLDLMTSFVLLDTVC